MWNSAGALACAVLIVGTVALRADPVPAVTPFEGLWVGKGELATCEDAAADLGFDQLWLETGDAQPEAVALYLSAGYEPVPAFGQYQHSPRSITLGKPLPAARCDPGVAGVV